jgi:hypothetical protein
LYIFKNDKKFGREASVKKNFKTSLKKDLEIKMVASLYK